MNEIPVIDFDNFDKGGDSHRRAIAHQVDSAASEVGFMYVTNLGVDQALLAEAFRSSAAFFARPESEKAAVPYVQEWNHGYQGSGGQRLDPSIAPDLKEAFTMRDVHKNENTPELWPSPEFLQIAGRMFDECLHAANRVMASLCNCTGPAAGLFSRLPLRRERVLALSALSTAGRRACGQPIRCRRAYGLWYHHVVVPGRCGEGCKFRTGMGIGAMPSILPIRSSSIPAIWWLAGRTIAIARHRIASNQWMASVNATQSPILSIPIQIHQ